MSNSGLSTLGNWHEINIVTDLGPNGVKTFYLPDTFKFYIIREVTLLKDCCDEQEAHYFDIQKPWIPKGTTLKVKYRWCNYYGMFYRCYYNDTTYDINACDCKEGPLCIGEFIGLLPDDYGRSYWDKRDWDPRHDGYQEINLEEYIENIKKKLQKDNKE